MNKNKKYKKREKRTKNSTFYLIFKFFANYFWKISENDEEKAKGILRRTHTYRPETHTHTHTHIHTYAYSDNCICNAVIIMIIYRIVDDNEPRSRNIIIANN